MIVGVIGSGAIGPDLAYGFVSALAMDKGSKVYLLDIKQEALDAGMARIMGYVKKGLARGKINPKVAAIVEKILIPTMNMKDLVDCDYVLEAASEELTIKRTILKTLENIVRPDCLIGFATSGIPRSHIAAEATHPERCFVNHPFFPAWRALPIEIVFSGDEALGTRMLQTMEKLGKVPIVTSDVPCFAADDIFGNYCSEAARIVEEGIATPAQVDAIINDAIGGGGPFNVLDLTRGNHLIGHCQILMAEGAENPKWFQPPEILDKQGTTAWHDRKNPGDPTYDKALGEKVLNRILAVVFARTYYVVDNGICTPTDFNWLSRMALGYRAGLLDLAEEYGADAVHDLCTSYAVEHEGFEVPPSIANKSLDSFYRNLTIERDGEIEVITVFRPEVKNALNKRTVAELNHAFKTAASDDAVKGFVVTGFGGALAGADIGELAEVSSPEEAEAMCHRAYAMQRQMAEMGKPIVAALNGPVLGGGAELSMACHARVVGAGLFLGQPEVNLGIIPGYGGTQRLPRLIGQERAADLLRTGRPVNAKLACEWGWAQGEIANNPVEAAKDLVRQHLSGGVKLTPVSPEPLVVIEDLPKVDLGHHSLTIDAILVDVIKTGWKQSLNDGLAVEAVGFGRCTQTVDMDIGMKNFVMNGPRVPAEFLHE